MHSLFSATSSRRSVLLPVLTAFILFASSAFAQNERVLYYFLGPNVQGPDGVTPLAGLIRDHAGNLYGTTANGGANGFGTVFKLDTARNRTIIHNFTGSDGANPRGTLIRDTAGNIFGTTFLGGAFNAGTVFKISWAGKHTLLYSFTGGADGGNPVAGLIRDPNNNLFGTAVYGGNLSCNSGGVPPHGCGVAFKVSTAGNETVLHTFGGTNDGGFPNGGLIAGGGSFYGTTVAGGTQGWGTIYSLRSNGTYSVLHSFIPGTTIDAGVLPAGRLLRDNAGNLYGTTQTGGDEQHCIDFNGCGAIFKLDPSGNITTIYAFANESAGQGPVGDLVRDDQGNLYGTTPGGGSSSSGTIFKVDRFGHETVLHNFVGTDGAFPNGTLLRDQQGNLYGTTESGGPDVDHENGVVFKLVP